MKLLALLWEELNALELETSGTFDSDRRTVNIGITLADGRNVNKVSFGPKFIENLTSIPPIERGRRIFEYAKEQTIP